MSVQSSLTLCQSGGQSNVHTSQSDIHIQQVSPKRLEVLLSQQVSSINSAC